MKTILNKLTIFYSLGIILAIVGVIIFFILINGTGLYDAMVAGFILIGFIPLLLIIIADRVCVKRYGVKKVNKVELYILGIWFAMDILIFILDWIGIFN